MSMWVTFLAGWSAWKMGSRSTQSEQFSRLSACAACDLCEEREVEEQSLAFRAAAGMFDIDAPTVLVCGQCGCLVGARTNEPRAIGVSINGVHFEPAGKPECASATCPHPDGSRWA